MDNYHIDFLFLISTTNHLIYGYDSLTIFLSSFMCDSFENIENYLLEKYFLTQIWSFTPYIYISFLTFILFFIDLAHSKSTLVLHRLFVEDVVISETRLVKFLGGVGYKKLVVD